MLTSLARNLIMFLISESKCLCWKAAKILPVGKLAQFLILPSSVPRIKNALSVWAILHSGNFKLFTAFLIWNQREGTTFHTTVGTGKCSQEKKKKEWITDVNKNQRKNKECSNTRGPPPLSPMWTRGILLEQEGQQDTAQHASQGLLQIGYETSCWMTSWGGKGVALKAVLWRVWSMRLKC